RGRTYLVPGDSQGDTLTVATVAQGTSRQALTATSSATITITEVLDASNTVPGQSATEGTSATLTGISITDPDATGNVTVTFTVAHGTLPISTAVANQLRTPAATCNSSTSVTVTGSLTQINNTLVGS